MLRTAGLLTFTTALAVLATAPAQALAPRTWVAKTGDDANPCTIALPCRTFQGAHDKTAPGGTVSVLTPGDYGAVQINRSISVTNDGVGEAGILAPGTIGAFITGVVGDVVSLRGLVIDGLASGENGIRLGRASALHIQKCVVRNFQGSGPEQFAGWGIAVLPLASASQVFISDTLVYNNGGGPNTGGGIVFIGQGSNSVNAVLERVRVENNVNGIEVSASNNPGGNGLHVMLRNSIVSGNTTYGVLVDSDPSHPNGHLFLRNSSVVHNGGFGVVAGQAGTILMSNVTVARNGSGLGTFPGAQIISYGNNEIDNNVGADGAATGFFAPR